jgi:lipoprotein-releasing system permease protein
MNLAYFIAKRINNSKNEDKKVSRPIIRISKISIVLAIVVNIVTIAVVTGFQNQIKDKVTGFGAHATLLKAGEQSAFETSPIVRDSALYQKIKDIKGVKNIQEFAYKPAMLQSAPDTIYYKNNQLDTFQIQQEIQGIVVKGVGLDFNWDFFNTHLIKGQIPLFHPDTISNEIVLSQRIASDLNLSVGDRVSTFFVKNNPIKDYYKVAGIFQTGLEEFDRQVVIGDIRKVQKLNDWGVQASIRVADTVNKDGQLIIYADVIGGNGNYRYDWGEGYGNDRGFTYCDYKDTTIRLIASDYWMFVDENDIDNAIADTAYLSIKVKGNSTLPCYPKNTFEDKIQFEYLNDDGTEFAVDMKGGKRYEFKINDGKGSAKYYVGGYEIIMNDLDDLTNTAKSIRKQVVYSQADFAYDYRVITIEEDQKEIFLWLSFLDLNVLIILVLMIIVSTINMGSGLLVLIITKTSMIGLLKALGANNWTIRKIFLHQASLIILKAMLWGNIIGLGLCYLQKYFTLIPLNPEIYYLNAVPIEVNYIHIILLNLGTLILCVSALVVPSWVVTKISPIKAIKFD